MTSPGSAFLLLVVGYGAGAVLSLCAPTDRLARYITALGALVGSAAGLWTAGAVLSGGVPLDLSAPRLLAPVGGLAVHLDALGAFFLALISLVGVAAAIYGGSYTAEYEGHRSLRVFGLMFNLFLFGMSLVPCAGNIFTFVLGWELMALASYALVMSGAAEPETRSAGLWYIGMTHVGLVLLLPMFFLMIPASGSMAFPDLRTGAALLSPGTKAVVFLLALLAFGSKAGLVPLHVWLPRAHPAAPSHVSALMSGVMIKLGIYGLVRVAVDFLGGGPAWWGGVILAVGSVSALLGVLYALMEHDLKRLLAYHSVENIGIIAIGLGAGLLLHSYHLNALATVAFAGALFHCLNHACFKALLFLGAGNVLFRTHTRNMEEMGGLIKRMPQTAFLFLLGSAAIAALPPLNGFASEWMVFQGLLAGASIPQPEVAVAIPIAAGMLALTSGLAAACFVKAFGISFLAMPRSPQAEHATEVPGAMRAAMWILGVACVALGLGSTVAVTAIDRVLQTVDGLGGYWPVAAHGLWITVPERVGQISPMLIAALLVIVALAALLLGLRSRRRPRLADTWGCGRIIQTPRMEYTAAAFAEPLRRVFAELYRPTQDLTVSSHPESRYFVRAITYRSEVRPWIDALLYEPVIRLVRGASLRVRKLQGGSVHLYLLYLAAALLAALASVWWL